MAKALRCDICGNFFDAYATTEIYPDGMSERIPNEIMFIVKFENGENEQKSYYHNPIVNPARTALSSIKNGGKDAFYDVCPDCVHQVASLLSDIYQENHNKEESE